MVASDGYVNALRNDAERTDAYHRSSVTRTEQQKYLEELLMAKGLAPARLADIACGGGSLSYHLRVIYPEARFTLCDKDAVALDLAKRLNGPTCDYITDDIHALSQLQDETFDLVCCWQTLSWISQPALAVQQLLRITKPGGLIMASSLFNLEHDVDITAQLRDRTRPSGAEGHAYDYNTFSRATVEEWVDGRASSYRLHPFMIGIDLPRTGRGIGTYTVNTDRGRLQVSGGLLMNWAILELIK